MDNNKYMTKQLIIYPNLTHEIREVPDEKMIVLTDSLTEDQKKAMLMEMRISSAQNKPGIEMIYESRCSKKSCKEDYKEFMFKLDRYPMMPEVRSTCSICGKFVVGKITNPEKFYDRMSDKDYYLKDLKDMALCIDEYDTDRYIRPLISYVNKSRLMADLESLPFYLIDEFLFRKWEVYSEYIQKKEKNELDKQRNLSISD